MGLFDNIKNRLGFSPQERTQGGLINAFLTGKDLPGGSVSLGDPYRQNIVVFRCVNLISTAMAKVPFNLSGSDGTPVSSGKEYDLYSNPNTHMDWNRFLATITVQLLRYGNVYIYKVGVKGKPNAFPVQLLPLPPQIMSAKVGNGLYDLEGWQANSGTEEVIDYEPHEIIHIQYADSDDPFLGISPMAVAALAVQTDFNAADFNRTLLSTGGLPPGLLRYTGPGKLTEPMKEELRESWGRTYGGPKAANKLAIVNSEWTYQPIGSKNSEMQFIEGRRWNLMDIARAFNVPIVLLNEFEGIGSGETGISIVKKMFYENNIEPLSEKLSRIFNGQLFKFGSMGVTAKFDFSSLNALREDFAVKVEAAQRLQRMGFSINDINRRCGLEMSNMPWGDDFFVPMNMVPADDIVNHTVTVPGSDLNDPDGPGDFDELDEDDEDDSETKEEAASFVSLSETWSAIALKTLELEKRCGQKVRRKFMSYRSEIVPIASGLTRSKIKEIISAEAIAEALMPFIIESYTYGIETVANSEEPLLRITNLRAQTDSVSLAAEYSNHRYDQAIKTIEAISETFVDYVEKEVARGVAEDRVRMGLRKIFNHIMKQLDILARTEVFSAFNCARYVSMRSAGVGIIKVIRSPHRNCKSHGRNGEIVNMGELLSTGQRFPGDFYLQGSANIGCDCVFVAEAA